jgi:glutathione S-transferase
MSAFSKTGEEQEKAAKEARENLKTLESGLEGKHVFGGETIGFVDIAVGWLGCWARMVGEIVGITLIDAETMPLLDAWFQDFLEVAIIQDCMPPQDKLLELNKRFHKILAAASN